MARFMRKGITKVWFCPSGNTVPLTGTVPIASVNTGTQRLETFISEMNGFSFSNSPIMTPDMGSAFVSQVPGEDASEDSSIKVYEDAAGGATATALTAMIKGTNGFIVICGRGSTGTGTPPILAVGNVIDVWPVTVSSVAKQYTIGNEAATIELKFAITAPPGIDLVAAA